MNRVTVVGAGLAGCEACWQLIKRNIPVTLIEMRPQKSSPAHHSENFAELVCSNSLRSNDINNAVGLLKQEMRELDSLIMRFADANQVPAGSALAVDREAFSKQITDFIKGHELVEVVHEELCEIPEGPAIIATGPLTSEALSAAIQRLLHEERFYFYDAAAPIIEKDSIDFGKAYYKSRYDKGDADYINCPMNKEEFDAFYQAVISAECTKMHEFEDEKYFEGCMPFEEMAKRGEKTLLYGPMKPVGLGREGEHPYAVVQLRQDNAAATLYNIVGFQTHLLWGEQKRVIAMIPGLENARFARYGVMHRNTYICSPKCLKASYECKEKENLFFAGQMCGVEGYVESAASGLLAGINMALKMQGKEAVILPPTCMIGAMAYYITHTHADHFQPMNATFGLLQCVVKTNKKDRKEKLAQQALSVIREFRDHTHE